MRSSFALAVGCAISVTAWPLSGLWEANNLYNIAPARMLVASANSSTNITTASCGNATACNSNMTLIIRPLQVKSVETSLAALAAILVALTYGLLTVYSPHLVNGLCVPREILSVNLQEILEQMWPSKIGEVGDRLFHLVYIEISGELSVRKNDQLGFYDLETDGDEIRRRVWRDPPESIELFKKRGSLIRGYEEVSQRNGSLWEERNPTVWIQTGSSAMRNVVQLVIWEWVSFWLVVIMIFNTLLYNGIIGGGSPTNDRYPRLALISIYSLLYMFHFIATWYVFLRVFTLVTLQASWAVCFRLPFALGSNLDNEPALRRESKITCNQFDVEVLGQVAISERYENAYADYVHDVYIKRSRYVDYLASFPAKVRSDRVFRWVDDFPDEAKVNNSLNSMQEAEVRAFEKATEVALERVVFNMAIIMGICFTTGFAVWTRSPLNDATSTQIGSYALLASTGTAFASIISSASQLSSMLNSAKEILRLTEVALHSLVREETKMASFHPAQLFGFAEGAYIDHRFSGKPVVLSTVWRANKSFYQKLLSLVFGPAIGLLPFDKDYLRPLRLKLQVHDRSFLYRYHAAGAFWSPGSDGPVLVPSGKSKLQLDDKFDEALETDTEAGDESDLAQDSD